ncbi:zinc finger protein [Saccharomonospora cyanea]|uniref:Zinc-finger domain-containing protein n=1 Tax=Saccharomonospora cyanea NA-134 TaxID=882082 RepID=H5XHE6_9PSEU|nr:zinc finger protein [Saccharomonospora cyanea]EHR60631.1 hypothetical protein SaccyDRAFT_1733 [Saccharomonospora cyanea NA-134]
MEPFRWQQAEGRRHAYNAEKTATPHPGIAFTTLCGAEVTPQERDFVGLSGWWHDPTCWVCDREWRVRSGFPAHDIPPLPENA